MDFVYSLRVLLNRLPILIIIPMIAAVITGVLTWLAPKQYQSEAQLSTGYTTANRYSLIEEKFNMVEANVKFNNIIEIINSPILMGIISYHCVLHDLTKKNPFSDFLQGQNENWSEDLYGIPQDSLILILRDKISRFELLSSFEDNEKQIIQMILDFGYSPGLLRQSMNIQRINYTDYLSINFISGSPFLSAFVVNTMSDEFIRYNNTLRFAQSSESVDFLSELAEQKKEILETKSNNLRVYKSRNQFLNFELESKSKIDQVKEAEEDRNAILNDIRRINLSLQSIDSKISDQGTPNSNRSNEIITLRNKLTDLNERRRNGSGDYRILSDSIFVVRRRLDNLITNTTSLNQDLMQQREALNVDLQLEEENLTSINDRLANLQREVSSFASTEATISTLQREVDISAAEYLEVQEKLNDARNANISAKDAIRIVVFGQPAIRPLSSQMLLKTGLAFMGSLAACVFVILLFEYVDTRIKTSSRFQQLVDIRLLGTIRQDSTGFNKLFKQKSITDENERSDVHALRKLRYEISSQEGRILLITSLKSGEGKSYITYALANGLGMIGKRVLIIDTNFRNNSFFKERSKNEVERLPLDESTLLPSTKMLGPSEKENQSTIFENYFISSKENENVHIMPNKNPEGSPAEVLAGRDFSRMLHNLIDTNIYDYILLEGAALNQYSDSIELSDFADKVILVFDALNNFSQEDKQTLKFTDRFNGKLLGGILNRAVAKV